MSRFDQIKSLHMSRNEITDNIEKLNEPLIKDIWEENLKKFINERLVDLTIDDFDNLQLKLREYAWMDFPTDIKMRQLFYTILTKYILLPSIKETEKNNYEIIRNKLRSIIDTYFRILDKKIKDIHANSTFHIWIWSEKAFIQELDHEYEIGYRNFSLGWIFGLISMWPSEKNGTYELEIPIKISIKKWATEQKYVDTNKIKWVIEKYFPKKWNSPKKEFANFVMKSEVKNDKNLSYWTDENASYFVITLNNSKHKYLCTDQKSREDIRSTIQGFLDITNLLTNELSKLSSINHWKRYFSFSSIAPYLEIDWDKELKWEIQEKFWKLLVKMKKPVYMDDIWWQTEAKDDVKKIIEWLKHKDIMKDWWASSTSWVLFYWPPWTGKTLFAMVIATEIDADVYNVKMTDIADSAYINDWPKNVKNLFEYIHSRASENKDKKIIIILDEIDALLKKRSWKDQSDEDKKIVNTFLAELWWFDTSNNVIFVGTTNDYHALDAAVIRSWRFTTKIKVELPNLEARKSIFNIHIQKAKKLTRKSKIFNDDINYNLLANESEDLSWADIEEVIRLTVESKAIEQIRGLSENKEIAPICDNDIIISINKIKSSNWKANHIIKWFSIDHLKEQVSEKGILFFREAVEKLLIRRTIDELQTWIDSWKLQIEDISAIMNNIDKGKWIWFWSKK